MVEQEGEHRVDVAVDRDGHDSPQRPVERPAVGGAE